MKKRKKNPLYRRLLRELREEFGKYLVIFLLVGGSIALISGFLVADNSVYSAYEESYEKYNIEDGHFRTQKALNRAQRKDIEELGVSVYDLLYIERTISNSKNSDSTLRIYASRSEVDQVCVMSGQLPVKEGEIALDRMYAENNGFAIGDTVESEGKSWTVTGLIAMSDYSCLYENNTDSMFDALMFGTAVVTQEEFDTYGKKDLYYNYAWKYDHTPVDNQEENSMSEDFLEELNQLISLEDYVPRYQNLAIYFTGEDMESDKGMMIVLLYMIIAILAFVFAVTIRNTIVKESNVIGTLRASGYTRGELIRHYMTLPVMITVVAALIGNILGYTVMIQLFVYMYYNSYSLPTYVTLWNTDAFLETTVVPILLMVIINWWVLHNSLKLSPQQMLRRDLKTGRKKNPLYLSAKIPFFHRFRTRVIFQNISNYLVLAAGILFANLILLFGMGFPAILHSYEENITDKMFCKYQYMLNVPVSMTSADTKLEELLSSMQFMAEVETDNYDAEKFMAYSLRTIVPSYMKEESVTIYGVEKDSRYVDIDTKEGEVYLSSAYADKFRVKAGDTISLKEEYEDTIYTFTVAGVFPYDTIAVFMDRADLNHLLDYDEEMFAGYFSDSEITDIDEKYLGTVIDEVAMTKISRQLDKSMGGMMIYVDIFAILVFMILMYLLSKIIIEKNAQAISMAKILGYSNSEIGRLYILPTTLVVIIFILISLPVEKWAIVEICRLMLMVEMTGWIPLDLDPSILVEMFFMGVGAYACIATLELLRIRKVPMDAALKNVE